ncbi:MAG: TldD/PmbA family protein [Acidobacteria bacterium]|nr:MAG: TldD/PmbA family protein [Acidobacteriota bacterium]REK02003.1 MAG: TldD/PmbA family protein [Acidobacteriota bacterium]REK14961.1 MAG: TldD/PmbA family protein [Acidobacteriota bacterium]REK45675.1 MAG: TldD/PmbA family protein [Acidobacteriota bacterium]
MLLSEKESREIAHKVLKQVKADDAQVSVSSDKTSHLRFARNAFLTSGTTTERSASITVWIEGKRGSSSTTDFSESGLKGMVEQAQKVAEISPVDREYLPTLGPQKYKPVEGFAENSADVEYDSRARSIARILDMSASKKVISAGFHQSRAQTSAFATKNGNFGYERETVASLSVTARTPDGSSSGYFQRSSVDIGDLDTEGIAAQSIEKCLTGRSAKEMDPGEYSVVLEPQAVGDLLGRLIFQFDARSAEEGRSPFSASGGKTKIGEKIFDSRLNVYSDPWDTRVPGSANAQGGIPAEKIYLVREGVLQNLIYSRFWAKKSDKEPTSGPVNMIMETTAEPASVEAMISSTKKGLLISRFWYIRSTDPRTASVTGLTRDGVWLIEDGKIRHPVNNFRFNQSMISMLAGDNVEMIGGSERIGVGNASLLPALRLRSFNFTSRSEAV